MNHPLGAVLSTPTSHLKNRGALITITLVPAGLCKALEHQEQEKPSLLQGAATSSHHSHIHDKDMAREVQEVAQGQGRTETAPESWSIPKNAASSFSCDPEAKSLPR